MDTYFPALFVPLFALPAILTYDGGDGTKFVHRAIGYGSGAAFEFGVHGVGFSGVVGRSERATVCVRWKKAYYLFILHHAFSICIWPYAVSLDGKAYFVNFFLVSELTNSNMATRWFLLKCKLESSTFYVERVSVDSVVSCSSVGDSFDVAGIHFWLVECLEPRENCCVYHAADSEHVKRLLARMIVMNAVKYLVTGKDPEDSKNSTVNDDAKAPMGNTTTTTTQRRRRRTNTEKT